MSWRHALDVLPVITFKLLSSLEMESLLASCWKKLACQVHILSCHFVLALNVSIRQLGASTCSISMKEGRLLNQWMVCSCAFKGQLNLGLQGWTCYAHDADFDGSSHCIFTSCFPFLSWCFRTFCAFHMSWLVKIEVFHGLVVDLSISSMACEQLSCSILWLSWSDHVHTDHQRAPLLLWLFKAVIGMAVWRKSQWEFSSFSMFLHHSCSVCCLQTFWH